MIDQPEKLDLASHNIPEDKKQELLRLFPEIRTEGGQIDFDKLKLALGETIDVGRERYGMTWPGKAECFRTIQAPSIGTLLPAPEESVDFDITENLIIEGDNLEVLKLLQKAYLGKVKMIYIDPPYNTGNDFIYPDKYTESLQTYLEYTGQVDAEGKQFGTNSDTDGRFHSRWLNMMYPRLYLAKNLLAEDGVIFMSIDDNEYENLRKLSNEIFGEENFIGAIVVQSNKRGQTYKEIAKTHEYLLIYSRNIDVDLNELEKDDDALPYQDSLGAYDLWELRNRNPKFGRFNRPNLYFSIFVAPEIKDESGHSKISLQRSAEYSIEVLPLNSEGEEGCWRWSTDKIKSYDLSGETPVLIAKQKRDGNWNIYEKSRKSTTKAKSLWVDTDVISEQGTIQLGELGLAAYFEHPKPVGLLSRCLKIASSDTDIVLDFFAGAGTLAHAILDLNSKDLGSRKFILVQLPEPTRTKKDDGSWLETAAWKAGFKSITEITKERVRRVISTFTEDEANQLPSINGKQDRGFRVFKLAESNFKGWDAQAPKDGKALEQQLVMHIEHIREKRTSEDILYEILLKSGFLLTTPVEKIELEGKSVFSVAGGGMLICLDTELTLELIRAMAESKPQRVVCLDMGFAGNDQLKTNAVQIFKNKDVVFKTV
jgi:adenine-specific DNA-methyltransferase